MVYKAQMYAHQRQPGRDGVTYGFFDAGYIAREHREVLEKLGLIGRVAYDKLGGPNRLRNFVYDCLDTEPKNGETPEQAERRMADNRSFFERVQSLEGFHLRRGALVGRRTSRREPRQKGVDVHLAVDMLTHAFRRNMEHAVLYTGDQDFAPLVRALVDAGTYVTLRAVTRSCSDELRALCDRFDEIRPKELAAATEPIGVVPPVVPMFCPYDRHNQESQLASGQLGPYAVNLRHLAASYDHYEAFWIALGENSYNEREWYGHPDRDVVIRLVELEMGKTIEWREPLTPKVAESGPG
jgi:uncharacterized LabA/DUF88 family protein